MRILLFLVLLFATSACETYNDEEINEYDAKIRAYIDKNNIECENSDSGLYFKIINKGEGQRVQSKDRISFTYKGTFLNGETFDEQTEPVSFYVADLIGAWKEIVLKLNEGGEVYLIAPPQLGYGSRNLDDIPANSILVYTLKVHKVE